MNEFQLTVTKRTLNADYEAQYSEWQKANRSRRELYGGSYGESSPEPQRFTQEQVLTVTVDAETFEAIRKAALETL